MDAFSENCTKGLDKHTPLKETFSLSLAMRFSRESWQELHGLIDRFLKNEKIFCDEEICVYQF